MGFHNVFSCRVVDCPECRRKRETGEKWRADIKAQLEEKERELFAWEESAERAEKDRREATADRDSMADGWDRMQATIDRLTKELAGANRTLDQLHDQVQRVGLACDAAIARAEECERAHTYKAALVKLIESVAELEAEDSYECEDMQTCLAEARAALEVK